MIVKASINIRLPSGRFPKGSFRPQLLQVRSQVLRDVQEAFAKQADPVNKRPWPARKQPANGMRIDRPLLVKSGQLRGSAIQAAAGATIVGGSTLAVRLVMPLYGKYHYFGTKIMARRRFFGISARTRKALARLLKGQAVRLWRRNP